MPAKRRIGKVRTGMPDDAWAFMLDQERPEGSNVFRWMQWEADIHRVKPRMVRAPGLDEVWIIHKAEVLAEWLRENPGARPRCWWTWDAPEPRREVSPGLLEAQAAYLKRLGLFVRGEARRLAAQDFEPEAVIL